MRETDKRYKVKGLRFKDMSKAKEIGKRFTNGDVYCQMYNDRIDLAVCVTRSIRQPEKCKGCPRQARTSPVNY